MFDMGRVTIIGNAGGGKSTLYKKLKISKGLPLFAVDKLQWELSWKPVLQEIITDMYWTKYK
jgi:adenylate kinase family enzyme